MTDEFVLPPELDLTVDDLSVLPDEFRYELIDGKLDIQQRAPLSELAGLGLLAALRMACLPGFQVLARMPLWAEDDNLPAPHVVVVGPDGDVVLVVEVVQFGWIFADVLARQKAYAAAGVPAYWVVECTEWLGASLTVFRATESGELAVESSTREVFTTSLPYPVTVDLPLMSSRWPETFEYVGEAR